MIIVKLLGGARKSFLSDKVKIHSNSIIISDLLEHLQKITPTNLPHLDVENILVAVNGIDSSALLGRETMLKDGDVISIIPLIHGGDTRTQFQILNTTVRLIGLKKTYDDLVSLLHKMRKKYHKSIIQIINSKSVLNVNHAKKIISISLYSKKVNTLLSDKVETDILMRFACTRQIDDAIRRVGIKNNLDSILIIIGKKSEINKLEKEILYLSNYDVFSQDNSKFIAKEFNITKKQIDSVISVEPLEDLLAEKSTVLFR